MTRAYNDKAGRLIVHDWEPSPTPLNPTLMRSVCKRAWGHRQNLVETGRDDRRCSRCEAKHSNGTPRHE